MTDLYTASEAIQRLKLTKSTFYYLVEQGQIPRVTVPLRKQAYYSRAVIDELAAQRQAIVQEYQSTPERLVLVRPTLADLEQLVEIDRAIWGEVGIIDPEVIAERFAHNPENVHVLKDTAQDKVLGGITMSPLAAELIEGLMDLRLDESDITPSSYMPFTPGVEQDCYVIGIVACQDLHATFYASRLLEHTMGYLTELVERGVRLRTLYTVATTDDGERLARKLGFEETKRGTGPPGDDRMAFKLDMMRNASSGAFVRRYQQAVKNQTRRAKRHAKMSA
jgi:predicted DNA-binding transcriptional regulator AlpA